MRDIEEGQKTAKGHQTGKQVPGGRVQRKRRKGEEVGK